MNKILSIPLPTDDFHHKVVWFKENSGTYTVKSGYASLLSHLEVVEEQSSVFKFTWALSCLAKIKIFMWQFMKNYVPCYQNLHFRRIMQECSCPRCHVEGESVLQTTRDCHFAKQIWDRLNYQWSRQVIDWGFMEWMHWLFTNYNNKKEEIAITIWAIWYARNKLIHEHQSQSVETIVTFIRGFGLELKSMLVPLQHSKPRAIVRWNPPPAYWVKLNVDASVSITNHMAATGFLIRNERRQIMGSGHRIHHLVSSVVMAEALAARDGLLFAKDLGFTKVALESDSRLVIKNINGGEKDYSETRPLTRDVNQLRRCFAACRVEFIAREGNGAAHAMATVGMENQFDAFWVEEGPRRVLEMVDAEIRCIYPP